MMMALKDGMLLIKDADATQAAVIRSWGKFRWNKSTQLFQGYAELEALNKLARMVILPPHIETYRKQLEGVQDAVDRERTTKDPKPLVKYPVSKSLYPHQIRAANMALLTFGIIDPKEVIG